MRLIWFSVALLVFSISEAVTPENVAIIPKLGELGDPDGAFLPELERLPEYCFANTWVEFGEDWLLKPCLGLAWAGEREGRWIVLNHGIPTDVTVKTMIAGDEVTVQHISTNLMRLPVRSQWPDLLAAPFIVLPNGRREPLESSYDLVHWIRNQQAFLSGRGELTGPKGILVSVYGSRREAMDALIAGEIDAMDDLSAEERRRIHGAQADVEVINRRSNELLYVLWNPNFPDLTEPTTREHLEMLMDKRRIASRAGST